MHEFSYVYWYSSIEKYNNRRINSSALNGEFVYVCTYIMAEVKFSDFQIDERYKRLERTLKLALLRKGKKQDVDVSWQSLMSPSISSINTDAFDSSTNVPLLQASRIGSEVVSSSNNLRNILLKGKDVKSDHKMTATSSVKKFNKDDDRQEDRFMMPPPNCNRILCTFKKSNSEARNIAKAAPVSELDCSASDIDKESPKERVLRYMQNGSNTARNKRIRIFTRWKVLLNEQGQLIIRGMIECGQIARSKPIIRRLTTTNVQSISKHVYYLQGDIVDDGYELPDYVRGKFYSGFPDDWENIYQIWRTFIQQGSKLTFRWPTPVADSDDDLKSEVTDITYASFSSPEDKTPSSKSFRETRTPRSPFNTGCTYNSPRSGRTSNLLAQSRMSNTSGNLCDNVAIQTPTKQCSCEKENYKQQESIDSSCFYLENKTNKLKDKLNGIVDNLDKNCPQQYMNKIIEIFDCLNYVMSHGSIKDDESNTEVPKLEEIKSTVQNQYSPSNSREYCQSEFIPLQTTLHLDKDKHSCSLKCDRTIVGNKSADYNDLLGKQRNFIGANRKEDDDDDSGSEIYAGVPKISAERVLQQKEVLIKPPKRKLRKQSMHQKHNITGNEYIPNVSSQGKSASDASRIAKVNSMYFNDSSVSIIGNDQTECLRVNKFINNTNVEDAVGKYYNYDVIEKAEREKANTFKRDESTHEMQEHLVQKHYRSVETVCDSFKASENNECEINGTTGRRNNAAETNSRMEIFKGRDGNLNHQHQDDVIEEQAKQLLAQPTDTGKRISKPVVISSVPVSVDVMKKQGLKKVDVVEKENNKELKKPNEDMQSLKQKQSPFKKPNSIRINSPMPLIHKKQDHEARNNVQLGNANSPISKKWAQDETRVAVGDQDENDCKLKLLTAWTPRVLQKPELCLIFEGKLLNDAGHVVRRKFKTDPVRRRVSPKLIETVNHEFYKLIGDINDNKHALPKDLLQQCRYGCPSRIEQFCKSWKLLQPDDQHPSVTKVQLNDTVDTINVGVSSKGRRIIPPLSYWTGERIVLKDNNLVYSPGTSQELLMNKSKKSNSDESKNTPVSGAEKSTKDLKNVERNKYGRFVTRKKRRIVQRPLEFSDSSDNENIPAPKKQKVKVNQRGSPNSADTGNKQDAEAKLITKPMEPTVRANGDFNASKEMFMSYQPSAETYRDIKCTFYQDIPFKDDILSDDQDSYI